jgi:hypothetical protein
MTKTIELRPTQFYQFKQKANDVRIFFECIFKKGIYYVTADEESLHKLGYDE